MDAHFPPISLRAPTFAKRRPEKSHLPPLSPEVLARRGQIAEDLRNKLIPLSARLQELSDAERKAIFYWIEHEVPINLSGTGLKAISSPSERFTIAVPRDETLSRFLKKVEIFETSTPKKGHVPNELLAIAIQSIREGGPMDRLSEELASDYQNLIRRTSVICEIEMLTYAQGRKKQGAELAETRQRLEALFESGTKGNVFEAEEIRGTCRAVIRCTGETFRKLVELPEWRIRIGWIEGKPKFETFHSTFKNFSMSNLGVLKPPGDSAESVCIIDSGVTSGNPFLRPVSREHLLKSYVGSDPNNPSDVYGHGSGVASLASYYALNISNGAVNEGKVWIASARVLDDQNRGEEGRLFSRVLTEVVDTFVPLGVRIFNLSVNIVNAPWNHENMHALPRGSWVARTIDRLSKVHDIIFVISAGNIDIPTVRSFLSAGKTFPSYLLDESSRLLDPAQAALAITVGGVAPGTRLMNPSAQMTPIASAMQPAPFTRCGPGACREIKPELVEYGGNYVYDAAMGSVITNPGTDVLTASNKLSPAIAHDSGTSLAAPRATHKLALILEDLRTLGLSIPSASLLRAFLVNSAHWDQVQEESRDILNEVRRLDPKRLHCLLGYGIANSERATYCDDYSVTMYYDGSISMDRVGVFDIPVPGTLSGSSSGKKRISVTLAFAPDVQRWGLERYLGTSMKWRLFRGDIPRSQVVASMVAEEEGGLADQEKPGELSGWRHGLSLRSRGTLQHDVVEWMTHQPSYSTNHYTLAVAAYERWRRPSPAAVSFSVVVRLEDQSRSVPIYAEVRQQIGVSVRVRSRG